MPVKLRKKRAKKKIVRWKSRPTRRGPSIVSRGLTRGTFPIKRTQTYFVSTNDTLPTNWHIGDHNIEHYLLATQVFSLNDLPDPEEFLLFKEYKINCVILKMTPLFANNYQSAHDEGVTYRPPYGASIYCQYKVNRVGTPLDSAFSQGDWNQIQARKSHTFYNGRPKTFKIYPKILDKIVSEVDSTTNALVKYNPYLSTAVTNIAHYGLDLAFSWVDPMMEFGQTADAAMPLRFRIDMTYLMTFKGVN